MALPADRPYVCGRYIPPTACKRHLQGAFGRLDFLEHLHVVPSGNGRARDSPHDQSWNELRVLCRLRSWGEPQYLGIACRFVARHLQANRARLCEGHAKFTCKRNPRRQLYFRFSLISIGHPGLRNRRFRKRLLLRRYLMQVLRHSPALVREQSPGLGLR